MKKRYLTYIAVSLFTATIYSQVGIGTTTPNGALDITSTTDGLLIPRIALTATNAAAPVITPTTSELVYNTTTSAVGINQVTPGYYYWSGSAWVRLLSTQTNDWSLTGNAGTVAANFLGTTDAQPLNFRTNNTTRLTIGSSGNLGIGVLDQTTARTFSYSNDASIRALVGYSDVAGGIGVNGRSTGAGSSGVFGSNDSSGIGVFGTNTTGIGTQGRSLGNNGVGVYGLTLGSATGSDYPVAVYGYAQGTGSYGVYGQANGAAAAKNAFGVYGEIFNTTSNGNIDAAAIAGVHLNGTLGLGYSGPLVAATNSAIVGISGSAVSRITTATTDGYHFGVMGELLIDSSLPGTTLQRRSGGIIGIGVMGVWGSAGYRNSGGNDFGIYSTSAVTGTAIGTGRNTNQTNANNSGIGLGVNGGVIGGYVSGEQYGFVSKGELFGAYIMGNTITNKPITQIETVNNNRVISYATTATTVDVTTRGKGKLTNGSAFVAFDAAFIQIAELNEENLNITITARGNTNGVYIEKITDKGFYVKENSNGTNSVNFNWTAVSVRKGYENGVALSKEILDANWESNMNKVMHNENSTTTQAKPIYFNGSSVLFTEIPKQPDSAYKKANSSVSEERKVATTTKELEFKLNKTKTNTVEKEATEK